LAARAAKEVGPEKDRAGDRREQGCVVYMAQAEEGAASAPQALLVVLSIIAEPRWKVEADPLIVKQLFCLLSEVPAAAAVLPVHHTTVQAEVEAEARSPFQQGQALFRPQLPLVKPARPVRVEYMPTVTRAALQQAQAPAAAEGVEAAGPSDL